MTKSTLRFGLRGLIGCTAALLGCAVELSDDARESAAAANSQALVVHSYTADFWPNGRVPVCLHPRTPETEATAAYAEDSARIRELVEGQYESVPNAVVDAYGWQKCTDMNIGSLPGWLRVIVAPNSTDPPFTRYCSPGATISTVGDCSAPATTDYEAVIFIRGRAYESHGEVGFDTGVLHEFGHVLARAAHEQDRADKNAACIYRGADTGAGSLTNYLTRYDPESIMLGTYCLWSSSISELDRLALELIYNPGTLELPVQSRSGNRFVVAGGAVLVREDDAIVTSWTFRGAHDRVYPSSVRWRRQDSSTVTTAIAYPATLLPAGVTTSVTATFTDFRNRSQLASGNVVADSGRHTAIMMMAIAGS
jgi:hypothetical protein